MCEWGEWLRHRSHSQQLGIISTGTGQAAQTGSAGQGDQDMTTRSTRSNSAERMAELMADRDAAERMMSRHLARVASRQAVLDAYDAQRLPYPSDVLADYQDACERAAGYAELFGFAFDSEAIA